MEHKMAASIKPSEERKDKPHYRNMHMCSGQAAQPDFPHKRIQIQKQQFKTVVALQSLQEAIMAETFVEFRTAFWNSTMAWTGFPHKI